MKKIMSVLLLAVLMFTMVSCGDKDIPDGMKLASASNVPYKFFVPMSWIADEKDNVSMAYYSIDDESNVTVTAYAASLSVDEFWTNCCEDYAKTFTEFTFNEADAKDTKIGGKNGKKFTYTAKIGDNKYKFLQVCVLKENMIYCMTYTSNESNFDKHIEDVDKMIETFVFR